MMVLYQSLIRNLFRALYNLSVSVLLLSASAKARKCQQEGPVAALGIGIPGIPRDGPGAAPARGEGKPNFSIAPQACDEGHTLGVPHPKLSFRLGAILPWAGIRDLSGSAARCSRHPRCGSEGITTHRAPSSGGFRIFQLSPTSAVLSQGRPLALALRALSQPFPWVRPGAGAALIALSNNPTLPRKLGPFGSWTVVS